MNESISEVRRAQGLKEQTAGASDARRARVTRSAQFAGGSIQTLVCELCVLVAGDAGWQSRNRSRKCRVLFTGPYKSSDCRRRRQTVLLQGRIRAKNHRAARMLLQSGIHAK